MKRKYILPALLVVQIVIINILSYFPEVVEIYYSNAIYKGISAFSRIILGWIPVSFGDLVYFAAIFFALRWFWKKRKSWKIGWKDNVLHILSVLSIFYFVFHLLWATNYHRVRLFEKMDLQQTKLSVDKKRDYTDAQLLDFTKRLIARTNEIQFSIAKNKSSKIVFPYTQEYVFDKSLVGYSILEKQYPFSDMTHPSIKKSMISTPLTYMGFAGYLNPFTNESQVNYKLPMYTFPTVTAHEMAHQIGYASESEANFIGYLASVKNEDLYFRYSGYVTALRYCLANWEVRNPAVLNALITTINPGILENYRESELFWDQYESFIETGFKIFYDNFLKMNQQKDGLESYSRFVDLLVNYYLEREL